MMKAAIVASMVVIFAAYVMYIRLAVRWSR